MPPPPDYYLNYFHELIDTVTSRYGDILQQDDWDFVHKFRSVNQPAQRLLVRLFLRKGPLFLSDKLHYPEVPDINSAISTLADNQLVLQNPWVRAREMIGLLPIAESRTLFSEPPNCRKAELLGRFEHDDTLKTPAEWGCLREVIKPAFENTIRCLNLLYFGNEHQSLTEFVLEDIGMMRFETLPLSPENRFFSSMDEIALYLHLNDLRSAYYEMKEARNFENLKSLGEQLLAIHPPDTLKTRFAKVANSVAYRLEQMGDLDTALALFGTNETPPSRERRCRIAYKMGNYVAARHLLNVIDENPMSTAEKSFHHRFVTRVNKKLNLPTPTHQTPVIAERFETWRKGNGTVEELACAHIKGAIWRENQLPLGVFGRIFWQVVFADINGVWHHRFQSAPADLKEPQFRIRRKHLIKETLNQSQSMWRNCIKENWEKKQGMQNPFVHWHTLTLDEVLMCFDAFNHSQWCGVFEHLLADIPHHRSGFPDLFVCDENGGRFIEVKGPGDRLRDNQILWLEVFSKLGITAEVCIVSYL